MEAKRSFYATMDFDLETVMTGDYLNPRGIDAEARLKVRQVVEEIVTLEARIVLAIVTARAALVADIDGLAPLAVDGRRNGRIPIVVDEPGFESAVGLRHAAEGGLRRDQKVVREA